MLFLCYPKCTTCQKARKWLDANGIPYELRDIKEANPSAEELKDWHKRSGLPLRRLFNSSGGLSLGAGNSFRSESSDGEAGQNEKSKQARQNFFHGFTFLSSSIMDNL